MTERHFDTPFPALTSAERYHFEVYGYVVIENSLTDELTNRIKNSLFKLKQDFIETGTPESSTIRGSRIKTFKPNHTHFTRVLETDPAVLEYITHPRLIGMIEEVVGDTVRLEESEAIINSPEPTNESTASFHSNPSLTYGFHAGVIPDIGTYTENGLFHSSFVKILTNLTDLGPDDGGTVVIAGSHKIKCSKEETIAAAYEDPSLIHQITAPAGSTLLFTESLIHATGRRRNEGDRVMIVAGYTPTQFQPWNGNEPSEQFIDTLPDSIKPLISGSDGWKRNHRFRKLGDPIQHWPK